MPRLYSPTNVNQQGYSDIGLIRKENEDYLINYQPLSGEYAFTIVADGMGGHTGGAVASRLAATAVADHLKKHLAPKNIGEGREIFSHLKKIVEEAMNHGNQELLDYKLTRPQLQEMGTTLVVSIVANQHLLIANVGDSRAYLYVDEKLQQMSKDHSVVQTMIDSGALTEESAKTSDIRNQLTQAIGIGSELSINFSQTHLLKPALLLLCSDGLTEYMGLDQLEEELSKGLPVSESCHRLIQTANQLGGKDNITVAISEYGNN
jgi:protein phosphatase